VYNKFS
jgi:hypothetical protein